MNFLQALPKANIQPKIAIYLFNRWLINFNIKIFLLTVMLWVNEGQNAIAQGTSSLPTNACQLFVTNGSFEQPDLSITPPTPSEVFVSGKIATYKETDVPGWFSSADNFIELWRNGNNTNGNVPAYEGQQFAELNAYTNSSLYQDLVTIPGSLITWQFAHRGRAGTDVMNLKIGSPGSTIAQINPTTGTTSFSTGNSAWKVYQGTYTVPAGQTTTRFEYAAISTANNNISVGNFLDAVRFGPLCDYGDAKSNYPVLKSNNGAAHVNDGVTFLGSRLGIELDGQPSTAANNDDGITGDSDQVDDEDGVTFATLNAGNASSVNVVASVPGYLNAWIDFNQDNDWDDPGEKIFTDTSLSAGTNNLSFNIPTNANVGNTFARFRFSTIGNLNPTGIAVNGEVEDYQVAIARYDYGDAPSAYGDASHDIPATPTLYLGSVKPDKELGTQLGSDAGASASGDDNNSTPDDEDAFTTLANVPTVGNYNLTVPVTNTSGAATLHAWIDFNRNSKFDPGEYQSAAVASGITSANLNWTVPSGTSAGNTHVRFRLTSSTLTDLGGTTFDDRSIGNADNGEVEDYPVTLAVPTNDYGDAPSSYGDASHDVPATPTLYLGRGIIKPDKELGTQLGSDAGAAAAGDDNNGDDEDAFNSALANVPNGGSYTITVPLTNTSGNPAATLHAWIDFNKNGTFESGEYTSVTVNNNVTSANPTWTVPTGTSIGNTYARFRLTKNSLTDLSGTTFDDRSRGNAGTGEVEDYPISIISIYDYGDAPDAFSGTGIGNYQTTISDGGASQAKISTSAQVLSLGDNIDVDSGSLQNVSADADDSDGTADDEDGVSNFPLLTTTNKTYDVEVTVKNNVPSKSAYLVGYIDFNKDGDFLDAGEKSATITVPSISSNPRSFIVKFTTPAGLTIGDTYARFRLSQSSTQAAISTEASSATDYGEIEDYKIAIAPKVNNSAIPSDFCQATSRNLLFILDDSSSVTASEAQQQRDAIMATLNDFVAKGLVGQAAIVGFDITGRTIIDYTDITTTNLASFQTALNTNYGVGGNGTNWEAGFQTGVSLGVEQPDLVFFFTDGTANVGGSPDDEAAQFKNAGAHIYGIGIDGLTVNDGFRGITDGDDTTTYDGSNLLEADFLTITEYSTLQNQYSNTFLANLCPADFGDAPDTYGTNNIAKNSSNTIEPLGANHAISPGLFLGATAPDVDANGFVEGIDNSSNATDDDAPIGTGTGNGDDEDNFVLPALASRVTSYSIPADYIIVTNTKAQTATLHAWIDFNKNGKFDSTEYASAIVSPNTTGGHSVTSLTWSGINVGTVGNTYARFRLTSDNAINGNTPGGAAKNGEVEDYQIAIASRPGLMIVKRITAINRGQADGILFDYFVDDPTSANDNDTLWPPDSNLYLQGVIDAGEVKPDDEVEYTVYFLSNGDTNAKEVKICDVVPDHMTFVKNTYGVELGIGLGFDPTALPTEPNLQLSNLLNDDQGEFYGSGTTPPANLCKKVSPANTLVNVNGTNNDNGAVVVELEDLPRAIEAGTPTNSYGFIRFRAKVK